MPDDGCADIVKRFLILAAFALPVWAQQPSPAKVQGVIAELEAQRQVAQTRAAQFAGELAEAAEREKADKAEIERLKKLCGKPCEPEKQG